MSMGRVVKGCEGFSKVVLGYIGLFKDGSTWRRGW
jgi:hypothetical protein